MNRRFGPMVALVMILGVGTPVAAAQRPVVFEFEKQWAAPDYYVGTVAGGGTIEMWLFDKRIVGNTQHFGATVEVAMPDASFTAVVSGQINFSTGRVVLNGTVTDGWLQGAQVQERSQLVDPDTGAFIGTIQINPASS